MSEYQSTRDGMNNLFLGQHLSFATGKDSLKGSQSFHGVWQLCMTDVVHLMEFLVLAEPLDSFVPSWVPVPRCSWLDQHLGAQELPLSFAGEPALVLRSSSVVL